MERSALDHSCPGGTITGVKKALIIGNWKSYVASPKEGIELLKAVDKKLPRGMNSTVVVCPPTVLLAHTRNAYSGTRIALGAQDVSVSPLGAHTGESPAALLRASGAQYVLVGHAERRDQGESNASVAQKARVALDSKLIPIICIGERMRDRGAEYLSVIENMLFESLQSLESPDLKRVVIAYEPVWAIGAPVAPGPRVISEAVLYVRKLLIQAFGRDAAMKVKILYGGAVDQTNAHQVLVEGNAQGFLVGRASVDAANFAGIIRACESKVLHPLPTV